MSSRTESLLNWAKQNDAQRLGELLQLYRNYLTILASTQLDNRLRRRVSPSDIVQETMLAAHRDFGQFRGQTEPELLGWLRQILINSLHRAYEVHLKAQRRDIRCEVSLDHVCHTMDRSGVQFRDMLADHGPTPSAVAGAGEQSVRLADQLATLRPEYRDVIVMRILQGLSFDEIAVRMDRKPGTVRMMWLRAIEKFRQIYEPECDV